MHDPVIFPEPERFYPERWLSPDAPTYPNPAFGFGARRCPGRLFTHASMWSMIVGILATFDITRTEDGPPEEIYLSGFTSCVVYLVVYGTLQ
jgi:cytochrome P450